MTVVLPKLELDGVIRVLVSLAHESSLESVLGVMVAPIYK